MRTGIYPEVALQGAVALNGGERLPVSDADLSALNPAAVKPSRGDVDRWKYSDFDNLSALIPYFDKLVANQDSLPDNQKSLMGMLQFRIGQQQKFKPAYFVFARKLLMAFAKACSEGLLLDDAHKKNSTQQTIRQLQFLYAQLASLDPGKEFKFRGRDHFADLRQFRVSASDPNGGQVPVMPGNQAEAEAFLKGLQALNKGLVRGLPNTHDDLYRGSSSQASAKPRDRQQYAQVEKQISSASPNDFWQQFVLPQQREGKSTPFIDFNGACKLARRYGVDLQKLLVNASASDRENLFYAMRDGNKKWNIDGKKYGVAGLWQAINQLSSQAPINHQRIAAYLTIFVSEASPTEQVPVFTPEELSRPVPAAQADIASVTKVMPVMFRSAQVQQNAASISARVARRGCLVLPPAQAMPDDVKSNMLQSNSHSVFVAGTNADAYAAQAKLVGYEAQGSIVPHDEKDMGIGDDGHLEYSQQEVDALLAVRFAKKSVKHYQSPSLGAADRCWIPGQQLLNAEGELDLSRLQGLLSRYTPPATPPMITTTVKVKTGGDYRFVTIAVSTLDAKNRELSVHVFDPKKPSGDDTLKQAITDAITDAGFVLDDDALICSSDDRVDEFQSAASQDTIKSGFDAVLAVSYAEEMQADSIAHPDSFVPTSDQQERVRKARADQFAPMSTIAASSESEQVGLATHLGNYAANGCLKPEVAAHFSTRRSYQVSALTEPAYPEWLNQSNEAAKVSYQRYQVDHFVANLYFMLAQGKRVCLPTKDAAEDFQLSGLDDTENWLHAHRTYLQVALREFEQFSQVMSHSYSNYRRTQPDKVVQEQGQCLMHLRDRNPSYFSAFYQGEQSNALALSPIEEDVEFQVAVNAAKDAANPSCLPRVYFDPVGKVDAALCRRDRQAGHRGHVLPIDERMMRAMQATRRMHAEARPQATLADSLRMAYRKLLPEGDFYQLLSRLRDTFGPEAITRLLNLPIQQGEGGVYASAEKIRACFDQSTLDDPWLKGKAEAIINALAKPIATDYSVGQYYVDALQAMGKAADIADVAADQYECMVGDGDTRQTLTNASFEQLFYEEAVGPSLGVDRATIRQAMYREMPHSLIVEEFKALAATSETAGGLVKTDFREVTNNTSADAGFDQLTREIREYLLDDSASTPKQRFFLVYSANGGHDGHYAWVAVRHDDRTIFAMDPMLDSVPDYKPSSAGKVFKSRLHNLQRDLALADYQRGSAAVDKVRVSEISHARLGVGGYTPQTDSRSCADYAREGLKAFMAKGAQWSQEITATRKQFQSARIAPVVESVVVADSERSALHAAQIRSVDDVFETGIRASIAQRVGQLIQDMPKCRAQVDDALRASNLSVTQAITEALFVTSSGLHIQPSTLDRLCADFKDRYGWVWPNDLQTDDERVEAAQQKLADALIQICNQCGIDLSKLDFDALSDLQKTTLVDLALQAIDNGMSMAQFARISARPTSEQLDEIERRNDAALRDSRQDWGKVVRSPAQRVKFLQAIKGYCLDLAALQGDHEHPDVIERIGRAYQAVYNLGDCESISLANRQQLHAGFNSLAQSLFAYQQARRQHKADPDNKDATAHMQEMYDAYKQTSNQFQQVWLRAIADENTAHVMHIIEHQATGAEPNILALLMKMGRQYRALSREHVAMHLLNVANAVGIRLSDIRAPDAATGADPDAAKRTAFLNLVHAKLAAPQVPTAPPTSVRRGELPYTDASWRVVQQRWRDVADNAARYKKTELTEIRPQLRLIDIPVLRIVRRRGAIGMVASPPGGAGPVVTLIDVTDAAAKQDNNDENAALDLAAQEWLDARHAHNLLWNSAMDESFKAMAGELGVPLTQLQVVAGDSDEVKGTKRQIINLLMANFKDEVDRRVDISAVVNEAILKQLSPYGDGFKLAETDENKNLIRELLKTHNVSLDLCMSSSQGITALQYWLHALTIAARSCQLQVPPVAFSVANVTAQMQQVSVCLQSVVDAQRSFDADPSQTNADSLKQGMAELQDSANNVYHHQQTLHAGFNEYFLNPNHAAVTPYRDWDDAIVRAMRFLGDNTPEKRLIRRTQLLMFLNAHNAVLPSQTVWESSDPQDVQLIRNLLVEAKNYYDTVVGSPDAAQARVDHLSNAELNTRLRSIIDEAGRFAVAESVIQRHFGDFAESSNQRLLWPATRVPQFHVSRHQDIDYSKYFDNVSRADAWWSMIRSPLVTGAIRQLPDSQRQICLARLAAFCQDKGIDLNNLARNAITDPGNYRPIVGKLLRFVYQHQHESLMPLVAQSPAHKTAYDNYLQALVTVCKEDRSNDTARQALVDAETGLYVNALTYEDGAPPRKLDPRISQMRFDAMVGDIHDGKLDQQIRDAYPDAESSQIALIRIQVIRYLEKNNIVRFDYANPAWRQHISHAVALDQLSIVADRRGILHNASNYKAVSPKVYRSLSVLNQAVWDAKLNDIKNIYGHSADDVSLENFYFVTENTTTLKHLLGDDYSPRLLHQLMNLLRDSGVKMSDVMQPVHQHKLPELIRSARAYHQFMCAANDADALMLTDRDATHSVLVRGLMQLMLDPQPTNLNDVSALPSVDQLDDARVEEGASTVSWQEIIAVHAGTPAEQNALKQQLVDFARVATINLNAVLTYHAGQPTRRDETKRAMKALIFLAQDHFQRQQLDANAQLTQMPTEKHAVMVMEMRHVMRLSDQAWSKVLSSPAGPALSTVAKIDEAIVRQVDTIRQALDDIGRSAALHARAKLRCRAYAMQVCGLMAVVRQVIPSIDAAPAAGSMPAAVQDFVQAKQALLDEFSRPAATMADIQRCQQRLIETFADLTQAYPAIKALMAPPAQPYVSAAECRAMLVAEQDQRASLDADMHQSGVGSDQYRTQWLEEMKARYRCADRGADGSNKKDPERADAARLTAEQAMAELKRVRYDQRLAERHAAEQKARDELVRADRRFYNHDRELDPLFAQGLRVDGGYAQPVPGYQVDEQATQSACQYGGDVLVLTKEHAVNSLDRLTITRTVDREKEGHVTFTIRSNALQPPAAKAQALALMLAREFYTKSTNDKGEVVYQQTRIVIDSFDAQKLLGIANHADAVKLMQSAFEFLHDSKDFEGKFDKDMLDFPDAPKPKPKPQPAKGVAGQEDKAAAGTKLAQANAWVDKNADPAVANILKTQLKDEQVAKQFMALPDEQKNAHLTKARAQLELLRKQQQHSPGPAAR